MAINTNDFLSSQGMEDDFLKATRRCGVEEREAAAHAWLYRGKVLSRIFHPADQVQHLIF